MSELNLTNLLTASRTNSIEYAQMLAEISRQAKEDPSSVWPILFGDGNGALARADQFRPRDRLFLPDVYRGENVYVRDSIEEYALTAERTFLSRVILPTQYTDQQNFTWQSTTYNTHVAVPQPEESVAPYMTQQFRQFFEKTRRFGVQFKKRVQVMNGPGGVADYLASLRQMQTARQIRKNVEVMRAIRNVRRQDAVHYKKQNLTRDDLVAWFQAQDAVTMSVQKSINGLETLVVRHKRQMANDGHGVPDTVLLDDSTAIYGTMVSRDRVSYQERGDRGPALRDAGPDAFELAGLASFHLEPTDVRPSKKQIDMLQSRSMVGEWVTMADRHCGNGVFKSRDRDVEIYDEREDTFVRIRMREAIENCGRFDENGDLHPDHYDMDGMSPENTQDMFLYTSTNGTLRVCQVFGQMDERYLSNEVISRTIDSVCDKLSDEEKRNIRNDTQNARSRLFSMLKERFPKSFLTRTSETFFSNVFPRESESSNTDTDTDATKTFKQYDNLLREVSAKLSAKQRKVLADLLKGVTEANAKGAFEQLRTLSDMPAEELRELFSDKARLDQMVALLSVNDQRAQNEQNEQNQNDTRPEGAPLTGPGPDFRVEDLPIWNDIAGVDSADSSAPAGVGSASMFERTAEMSIADELEGIGAVPRRTTASRMYQRAGNNLFYSDNAAFAKRVGSNASDAVRYAIQMALLFTPIDKESFMAMINYDVNPPVQIGLFRPFITHDGRAIVIMKRGTDTGVSAEGNVTFMIGDIASDQSHVAALVFDFTSFVHTPENVAVLPNVMLEKYRRGNDATFFTNEELLKFDMGRSLPAMHSSIFAIMLPGDERLPTHLDIRGHFTLENPDTEAHYSSAQYYAKHYKFEDIDELDDGLLETITAHDKHINTRCVAGAFRDADGKYTPNRGALGWTADGVGKVRSGEEAYLEPDKFKV